MTSTANSALLAPDEATDHIVGPVSAKAIVIECGNFESPSCATFYVNGTLTDVSFGLQHLEQSVDRALHVGMT
jgi:hypothetical protein